MKKKNFYRQLSVLYKGSNYVFVNGRGLQASNRLHEHIKENTVLLSPYELIKDQRIEDMHKPEFDPFDGEGRDEVISAYNDYYQKCKQAFQPGRGIFRQFDPEERLWDKYWKLIHK